MNVDYLFQSFDSSYSYEFTPFPLLRLPLKNLKSVLLEMGPIERTIFSMLSDKTKDSTRALCIFKGFHLSVKASDSLKCGFTSNGYENCYFSFKNGEVIVKKPNHITFKKHNTFTATQFDERSWLNHFLYICNPSEIDLRFQYYNRQFDESQFQIVQECSKGLKIDHLDITWLPDFEIRHTVNIMNAFSLVNDVYMGTEDYLQLDSDQLSTLRQIWPLKFIDLTLTLNMALNDLLLLNCVSLDICSCELSEKDMNVFMKHWVAGLIPELKHLYLVRNGPPFNHQNVLEGIPYQLGPVEREIKLHQMHTQFGGIDIQIAGGVKATLTFCPSSAQFTATLHNTRYISFK